MSSETRDYIPLDPGQSATRLAGIGALLFVVISLFYWITVEPFPDLSGDPTLNQADRVSSALNQIVSMILFACVTGYGLLHPMRRVIFQPRTLLSLILLWIVVTTLHSGHVMPGFKASILAIIVTANASVYLLLPQSERHFAKLLAISTLILLAVSYLGVLLYPSHAIHQATEVRETANTGLWRGPFRHKNDAAVAMVIATFFGLFVMRVYSRFAGVLIILGSLVFLLNTGGKTATAMLPAVIGLAWLFERSRILRVPVVVGGLLLLNFLALGSAVIQPISDFISGLGIDATFTNRVDVWRIALPAAAEAPIFGHGLRGFWQTGDLLYSGNDIETWAITAAHAHNSYVDTIIALGFPGLFLTLIWILVLPFMHFARMEPAREQSHLTRLFLRIWLYVLFHASLESFFYNGSHPMWFVFLVAIYGLRLQSSARLTVTTQGVEQRGRFAHA